ncbi:MAG: Mitochondrial outer membrane protein iml2 [Chrysothrix sp. TS-e1954]|nr:MAG: Mitochondrial outer membrane protein iml2 [Chrysothrix sp. TS-e1954]
MNRFNFWSSSTATTASPAASQAGKSSRLSVEDEIKDLESATGAVEHIMNDDIHVANEVLDKGDSAYHQVGRAITTFLQAAMGVEKDVMKQASERLAAAESVASSQQQLSIRDPLAYKSSIYAPGTEFALMHAQVQIMAAVVGVMSESLTESIKGFYKVRKAFMTLDSIHEMEKQYLKKSGINVEEFEKSEMPGGKSNVEDLDEVTTETNGMPESKDGRTNEDDDDDYFQDANDTTPDNSTSRSPSKQATPRASKDLKRASKPVSATSRRSSKAPSLQPTKSSSPFTTHPIDRFIHSSNSLQFGILLLLISLIPPAFSPLLTILSFRGDRTRGLSLIWRTASNGATNDVNAAIAALTLLEYYAIIAVDITPSSSYPKTQLTSLLLTMRARYPNSKLWYIQEARVLSSAKRLEEGVAILTNSEKVPKSPLKQTEALQAFETALDTMYLHRYDDCATWFRKLPELNNWGPAVYYYIAGAAHVELYRIHKHGGTLPHRDPVADHATPIHVPPGDEPTAKLHASKAMECFAQIPKYAGKKRLLARQLPFDMFVARKHAKWTATASARAIPFIDAIGVSPVEEMIFLWNGHARMREVHLHESLRRLAFSDAGRDADPVVESGIIPQSPVPGSSAQTQELAMDERALLALLRGVVYRHLGHVQQARSMLNQRVVAAAPYAALKKIENGERWIAPLTRYELAVGYWQEAEREDRGGAKGEAEGVAEGVAAGQAKGEPQAHRQKLERHTLRLLEEVAHWESFELEARMGMKVSVGRETLRNRGITVAGLAGFRGEEVE